MHESMVTDRRDPVTRARCMSICSKYVLIDTFTERTIGFGELLEWA